MFLLYSVKIDVFKTSMGEIQSQNWKILNPGMKKCVRDIWRLVSILIVNAVFIPPSL